MQVSDARVRRPQQYEVLLRELREDGVFTTMRDILLFAAAVGFVQQRRVPFDTSAEPIRYETLTDPSYAETLVNMVAAVELRDDAEILDKPRLNERIGVFEEYANGGLEFIQEQMNVRHQSAQMVIESLVTDALAGADVAEPVSVEDLLESTGW